MKVDPIAALRVTSARAPSDNAPVDRPPADSRQPADEPRRAYTTRLNARRASLAVWQARHRVLGNVRVCVFLGALAMAIASFVKGEFSAWWLAVPAAILVACGPVMARLEARADVLARAIAFYERGLARIDGRWAGAGETGARFADERHLYAPDLDIFGEGSLFELLCGARTRMGEGALAAWLLAPAPIDTITARQIGVREIAPALNLREDLALAGDEAGTGVHADALIEWSEREPALLPSSFRAAAWALSLAGAVAIVSGVAYLAALLGVAHLTESTVALVQMVFLVLATVCFAVDGRFKGRTARIIREVDQAARHLGLLAALLRRLEAEHFSSPLLASLRAQLNDDEGAASVHVARLSTLVDLLDFRRNEFMKVIGPLLLWNLHLCYAVEDWRTRSGRGIRRWLHAVGEMEAFASLAAYCYEHPGNAFPELVPEPPLFHAEELTHPLLDAGRAVPNDVSLGGNVRLLVVSGSNMSGKSTLLRTIGVNAVLAQAGAPVCARRLRLSPLTVGASIRIADSLQDGTSRFYAEISKLSGIMDVARTHPPALFLIDECLHGTNSHDRLIGAEAVVRGLLDRGAIGLITTHDLALTRIAEAVGPHGANVHFQDYLENGRMRFDYRMRPGVVEHNNALELMRSVGLDV
jgi:hypothetical protein